VKIDDFFEIRSLERAILITGHTGFKGSWLGMVLSALDIPYMGMSLKPEKDSLYLQARLMGRTTEEYLDIRNRNQVERFFLNNPPGAVIDLAAQPLVLKSYELPHETFDTNVLGTINLLHAAFSSEGCKAFIGVTTDKVYRNDNSGRRFVESDPLEGKDPYSSSKVGTESALAAWRQLSNLNNGPKVISVRAGNVIGGGDLSKNRIVPDIVRAISTGETAEIRNPNSTRPWQHVLDPLFGYLVALEKALSPNSLNHAAYNFGPIDPSASVSEVVAGFKEVFSTNLQIKEHPGISRYESTNLDLDSSLANRSLRWIPKWSQREAINLTALWWAKVLSQKVSPADACQSDISNYLRGN